MPDNSRYSRQLLFAPIGAQGQQRLADSTVLLVGCGALGSMQAEMMTRAGVGRLIIADRDFVEESNLQRQVIFEEEDARQRLPKAVAAAKRLRRVNRDVAIEPIVADVSYLNVESLIARANLVLDGTDNFDTRFLLNDACVKGGIPWIYGAVVSSYGLTMTVRPGETPCLTCILESIPDPAAAPTCDTAGVLMSIIGVIASVQVSEALKLLIGAHDRLHGALLRFDVWDFGFKRLDLSNFGDRSGCRTCGKRDFQFLNGANQTSTTLCGRNAVQIAGSPGASLDLAALASRLEALVQVAYNDYLVRFDVEGFEISVFRDGRGIIRGTSDPAIARSLYARYVGA